MIEYEEYLENEDSEKFDRQPVEGTTETEILVESLEEWEHLLASLNNLMEIQREKGEHTLTVAKEPRKL